MDYSSEKFIWKWPLAVFVVIAVTFVAAYFFFLYNKSQGTNETAGWKTHKSDIYDYEIKYPPVYKFSKTVLTNVPGIENIRYMDEDYYYDFQVFARNNDFIVKDCLKDLQRNNITKTREVNGNIFYVFEEKKQGGIESEYHIMRNNQCYIVSYKIVLKDWFNSRKPTQMDPDSRFETLNQIFSTFKFTNNESASSKNTEAILDICDSIARSPKDEWRGQEIKMFDLPIECKLIDEFSGFKFKIERLDVDKIRVDIYDQSGKFMQDLEFENFSKPYNTDFNIGEDINFDGYRDIRILNTRGASNTSYDYWIFNSSNTQFVKDDILTNISNPTFDSSQKIIHAFVLTGVDSTYEVTYKFKDGQYYKAQ